MSPDPMTSSTRREMNEFRTYGQLIKSTLKSKGWNQQTLAMVTGYSDSQMSRIIAGKARLTADFALILEEILGLSAPHLLDLQMWYDLALARYKHRPDPAFKRRLALYVVTANGIRLEPHEGRIPC